MALLPIHPPPEPGEALSSWVARLARAYHVRPAEFASWVGGRTVMARELDSHPLPGFVEALADRTGVDPDEIRGMSIDGCIDRLQGRHPLSVGTVLIPPSMGTGYMRSPRVDVGGLWSRSCALCMNRPESDFAVPLVWRWSFSLSCPVHGVLLERQDPLSWRSTVRSPTKTDQLPTPATEAEVKHDSRLAAALRGERVEVRVGVMDASTWLTGLAQLKNELLLQGLMLQLPAESRRELGLADRDRRLVVRTFPGRTPEVLGESSYQRFARAIAIAVDLIEHGRMMAMGRGAFVSAIRPKVLRPRPERVQLTYSEPPNPRRPPFDWGDDPPTWEDWFDGGPPSDARKRYRQHVKRGEPKAISS